MKTLLCVLCILCATAAVGQSYSVGTVLNTEIQPLQLPSHPARASQRPLAAEQSLLEHFVYSYAQGERPLWEFKTPSQPVPLGDVARAVRKEHEMAKKAEIIWTN